MSAAPKPVQPQLALAKRERSLSPASSPWSLDLRIARLEAPSYVECFVRTGHAAVPGLGKVSESYVWRVEVKGPACATEPYRHLQAPELRGPVRRCREGRDRLRGTWARGLPLALGHSRPCVSVDRDHGRVGRTRAPLVAEAFDTRVSIQRREPPASTSAPMCGVVRCSCRDWSST